MNEVAGNKPITKKKFKILSILAFEKLILF